MTPDELAQHVCEGVDASLEGLKWLRRGRLDVAVSNIEVAIIKLAAVLREVDID
jgi:hypothetical protein